ncbi:general substrate transporter [Ilyonectria sp. MPI-CAGE-AT-0026]|nr:general substrate transporter [Ilyonectria sp. MPI-CAGE-AT-0026]
MGLRSFFKNSGGEIFPPELLAVLPADPKPWYRTKHLLQLSLLLVIPLLSSSTIGFDGAMMNGLQTLPQWREAFNHPSGALLGLINAIYPISKVFGMFPSTWIGDRFGRKKALYVGLTLLPIGAALQGSSQNTAMFIVSRSILGFSTSFLAQPSPILVTELAYPTHRAKVTSLYNTCFYLGAVLAAWSTYGTFRIQSTWAWRIPSLLQQAIPLVQTIFVWWVPESPRWLLANGREEEGRRLLVRYHGAGDESSPLVDFEVKEIQQALEIERSSGSSYSYFDLFRTGPNRHRTALAFFISLFTQWNGCSVLSYYLVLVLNTIGITETSKQTLINGMLQIFNWIVAICGGALLVDRVGRRRLFLVATIPMFFSYIAWTILNAKFAETFDQRLGNAVPAFIFIYYFFYDIIFPYTLRGRGMTTYYMGAYAGLISGQFLNPIAMKELAWRYYIVFCVILFFLIIGIYLWVPENKGRTLEEIAEIFDGPRSALTVSADDAFKNATHVSEVEVTGDERTRV